MLSAIHFPLTGTLLSLNQVFLISRALHVSPTNTMLPCTISMIAGVIKSASPFGKKIIPLFVISFQGFLYTIGLMAFGNTLIGRIVGASLLSMWGVIQPFLVCYLFFDTTLYQALFSLLGTRSSSFLCILLIFAALLKVIAAIGIVIATPYLPQPKFDRYLFFVSKTASQRAISSSSLSVWHACKDLLQPMFLICLGLTTSFLYFVQDSPHWFLLGIVRPVAIAFFCFFLFRSLPLDRMMAHVFSKHNAVLQRVRKL